MRKGVEKQPHIIEEDLYTEIKSAFTESTNEEM